MDVLSERYANKHPTETTIISVIVVRDVGDDEWSLVGIWGLSNSV